jgi:predicted PurR-regulated permease PerM
VSTPSKELTRSAPPDIRRRAVSPQVVIAPRSIVTLVAIAVAAAGLVVFAYTTRAILAQLFVAIVLAMALEPFVQLLERRGTGRGRAVGITFVVALLAVAAFIYLLVPPLVHEVRTFGRHTPDLVQQLVRGQGELGFLERRYHVVEHARAWLGDGGGALFAKPALHAATGLVGTAAAAFAVAFLTLFVCLDGHRWFNGVVDTLPAKSRDRWRRAGTDISSVVGGYVTGNLLISFVAGTVTTLILVATHVPYPVPLGLVVAIFDLIPLVGATIATVIVAAVALPKGVPTTVIVVAGMVLYQQIENHTLTPLVYHRTVRLSPLAVAVSVAAGAEVAGVVGALLAIPVAGALKVAVREVLDVRRGTSP